MSTRTFDDAWVIVEARKQQFAIPALYVREVVAMPEITTIPHCGPQYRGVMNLRGRILPLIDLRKQFGWQSVPEEMEDFSNLMAQREQDHRNWLAALQQSVVEGGEFRLARDPHKCAFGKWYDSYHSESPWVTALLKKFDQPHQHIHALAASIDELMKQEKQSEALCLIEEAHNGVFLEMVSLFQQLKELMFETVKELAIVLTPPHGTLAVSVDSALGVERIPAGRIEEFQTDVNVPGTNVVHRAAHRAADNSLAMILEPDLLVLLSRRARNAVDLLPV